VANIVLDMARCSVQGECAVWTKHLGMIGVSMVTVIMGLYAVMPLLIRTFSHPVFKVAVSAITVFITLFYIAHELTHLRAGDKPFGVFHTLDIIHHGIAIWMIVVSVMWVRQKN
jgi:hypothetical protein